MRGIMTTKIQDFLPATVKQKQAIVTLLKQRGGVSDGIFDAEMTSSEAQHFLWLLYRERQGTHTELTDEQSR